MSMVKLVGVGPGHPGLATVQAVEAIKDADVIRHSDGCGVGLLHFAAANADIGPLQSTDEIVRIARTGKRVTVLFPGNPYAFSNGSEVAEKLERAGVDFEAVPGLIVELAAPVMSGIPLTLEGRSASIGFGLVTLYYKLDIVMLSKLDTLESVGQYSIGYKFADLASYVPFALLTPVLSLMISAWPRDTASLRSHFRQAFVLLAVAATAVSIGFACVAQPVVELLYGSRYAPSVGAARYLVAGAALQYFSYLCFTTFVSIGRNRSYALAGLAGVLINAGLNFALIPRYSFNGSAVATVITEACVFAILLVSLSRTAGIVTIPVAVIVRALVAGAGMAGVYGVMLMISGPALARILKPAHTS